MNKNMKLFYSCENFVKNETDVNILKTFDESTEFLQKERRYQVKLPVKFEHEELGDNYTKSKQRLKSLLNTFNKGDSDLLFEYDRIIKEQEICKSLRKLKRMKIASVKITFTKIKFTIYPTVL